MTSKGETLDEGLLHLLMMLLRTLDDVSSISAGLFHVKEKRPVARLIVIGKNMSIANSNYRVGEHTVSFRLLIDLNYWNIFYSRNGSFDPFPSRQPWHILPDKSQLCTTRRMS